MRAVVVALGLVAGCHVVERNEIVRPGASKRITITNQPIARRPAIMLTDQGRLRFVEPLECATVNIVQQSAGTEVVTKPNLATFVVGIIATSVGAIATINGVSGKDPGGSPFTYAGIGLVGAGLPFAIGPWLNAHTELVPGEDRPEVRTQGPTEPCGERAITGAKTATLMVRGVEIHGAIQADGVFSVPPYALIDAYETTGVPAWDVIATLDGDRARTITTMIDAGSLATQAHAFLATADFNAKIEPMRLVPGVVPGLLRVEMTRPARPGDLSAIRIVLPVKNDGPGPAWALRGHITAPGVPAIDGRVLYIGALAKGETRMAALSIPVSDEAADALHNAQIDLSVELRDAHGTAPSMPVRFRGPVMVDPTR